MKSVLFAFLLAAALPLFAQQDIDDARRTLATIEALLRQRPDDATLHFYAARTQAQLGDARAATAALDKATELGEGFMPAREEFAKVWDDPAFQAAVRKLESKLPRLDYAPTAFELEDTKLLPEGIAYDAPSQNFFIGSTAQGKIVRIAPGNATSDFANRLDPVLGIAVDSPRRLLYAVTTSALTDEGRKHRRNAVMIYDVDSARLVRRVDVPDALQLNDVTVAAGGRAFASDSASGAVYEIPREGAPRVLLAANQVRGSNGLAASRDVKRLYVAHSTGIAIVDLATGSFKRLANATRETVAAIDGLYEWQGELIGVQNVTTPGRVIAITLSKDGESVTRVRTLLSHHHNRLDEPTTGAVTERGFFLLGATGVTHLNAAGGIDNPDAVPKPTVLRIPLPR